MRKWPSAFALLTVMAGIAIACAPAPKPRAPGGTELPTQLPAAGPAFTPVRVFSGLTAPINVEFASNGRAWVAEHSGRVLTYDSVGDPTSTLTIDIRGDVRSWGDHGLLGMAVDPQFPTRPYLYVLYSTDPTGRWGDSCPVSYTDGCQTGARVERLTLDANGVATGARLTLADNRWCYQFSSHAAGDLKFLGDGTLLASSGEGATWADTDYGQHGGTFPLGPQTPVNPCGDPPGGVGVKGTVPTAEGGSLRSQDLLTAGDPQGWNGAIVRIDPDTGAPVPDNALIGGSNPNDDHIVAHGLRNPFRFTVDPISGDVLAADVGENAYEEIDRFDVHDNVAPNFGWPCDEGPHEQPSWAALKMHMCTLAKSSTAPTTLTKPWLAFWHNHTGASLSGIAVIDSNRYPAHYDHSIAFADYVARRIYTITPHADGTAEPTEAEVAANDVVSVDLQQGPDGFLYTVDIEDGSVHRLADATTMPVAKLTSSAVDGGLPLAVTFDATTSVDPTGQGLTHEWDLDGDGQYDDATGSTAARTFTTPTNVTVGLRVRTTDGVEDVDSVTVYPGNTAPEVTVNVTSPLPWSAHDNIDFNITATDDEEGTLPLTAVSWTTQLQHCHELTDCHNHPIGDATASLSGSVEGPSHEYPSFLLVNATATDARGEQTVVTRQLQPAITHLVVNSSPWSAEVIIGSESHTAPATIDMIKGSDITVTAVSPQVIGGFSHVFQSWSDGGTKSHSVVVDTDKAITVHMVPG